jgi:hypothetical protein
VPADEKLVGEMPADEMSVVDMQVVDTQAVDMQVGCDCIHVGDCEKKKVEEMVEKVEEIEEIVENECEVELSAEASTEQ